MIMMTILIYALTLNIDKKERKKKELCMKEAVLQNVTSDLVTVVTF